MGCDWNCGKQTWWSRYKWMGIARFSWRSLRMGHLFMDVIISVASNANNWHTINRTVTMNTMHHLQYAVLCLSLSLPTWTSICVIVAKKFPSAAHSVLFLCISVSVWKAPWLFRIYSERPSNSFEWFDSFAKLLSIQRLCMHFKYSPWHSPLFKYLHRRDLYSLFIKFFAIA